MKKLFAFFAILLVGTSLVFAQIFDSYNKLLILEPTRYKFNVHESLASCFKQKGFKIYLFQTWSEIPTDDWERTMSVEWEVFPAYGAPSTVKVTFKNSDGRIIYSIAGEGMSLSLGGDVRAAVAKIVSSLRDIPYHFRPSIVDESKFPPIRMSEDSVRSYLSKNRRHDFEGIYKTYGENWYRIAIIRQGNKYVGFILDSESKRWHKGDVKAYFEPVKKNLFSTTFLMQDKSTREVLSTFDGEILSIPLGSDAGTFQALKIFPTNESASSGNVTSSEGRWVASGSGFFVADRVVATNYHVIDEANGLKVVVYNGSDVKSYEARVLASDKTNDLALISIVDKEFKGISDIPYSLYLSTKEVGTSVFAMGYPMTNYLGGEVKVTNGIINSKTGYQGDIVTYQISAPIQPGNSGGALFDKDGVLVGITNAGVSTAVAENVGYAIKAVYLKNLIEAAPIYIEFPKGKNLVGKPLTDLVKILSPYVVFIEVY